MDNQDHKNTWNNFTKFVLWGTVAVIGVLGLMAIPPNDSNEDK